MALHAVDRPAARFTGLSDLAWKARVSLTAWRRNRRARVAFNALLSRDDHILADIGVTRADVEEASRLPLTQSAALALQAAKRRNQRAVTGLRRR